MEIRRLGQVGYDDAWDLQRATHAAVADGAEDVVLLLEHEGVYTAGRRTEPWERPTDGSRVVDVDRGGRITWHGPGQLTGYPIVRLAEPLDVVSYVRRLEQVLIDACAALDLETRRVDGRSGVWTADGARKVAAIGIRVSRGVTMHGFALNCDNPLTPYDAIVACGIADAGVTTLSAELGRDISVGAVLPVIEPLLLALGRRTGHCVSGLPGWDESSFSADGRTFPVFRQGSGPGVIVIHESPNITPQVARFGQDVVDAGFTVVMPSLSGTPGAAFSIATTVKTISRVCVSSEFETWRTQPHLAHHDVAACAREGAARGARRTWRRRPRDVHDGRLRPRHDGRRARRRTGAVATLDALGDHPEARR